MNIREVERIYNINLKLHKTMALNSCPNNEVNFKLVLEEVKCYILKELRNNEITIQDALICLNHIYRNYEKRQ